MSGGPTIASATMGFMVLPHLPVAFAGAVGNTRFAGLDQIDRGNARNRKVTWTYGDGTEEENTPVRAGDMLFVRTPHYDVTALDTDTGRAR